MTAPRKKAAPSAESAAKTKRSPGSRSKKTGHPVQLSSDPLRESLRQHRPTEITYLVPEGDDFVLDGAAIKQAAEQEGVPTRAIAVKGVTDAREARRAIQKTARRRDPLAIAAEARHVAAKLGVELGRRGRGRESTALVAREMGLSHEKVLQRALRTAKAVEHHPDIAVRLATGELTPEEAVSEAKRRDAEAKRATLAAEAPAATHDDIDLRLGSFVDVLDYLKAKSVRAFITDPMWQHDAANLKLWDHLGALAKRTLTDDGMLVVYSGGLCAGEAIVRLSAAGLRLVQIGSLACPSNVIKTLHAIETTTPILYFTTGAESRLGRGTLQLSFSERREDSASNLVYVETHDRSWHEWQKPLNVVRHHVEALTDPGDLVVDPFLGGATTAVACLQTGRRFVGAEIDPETLAIAKSRLAKVTPGVIEEGV